MMTNRSLPPDGPGSQRGRGLVRYRSMTPWDSSGTG